jgi:hypothetical protein
MWSCELILTGLFKAQASTCHFHASCGRGGNAHNVRDCRCPVPARAGGPRVLTAAGAIGVVRIRAILWFLVRRDLVSGRASRPVCGAALHPLRLLQCLCGVQVAGYSHSLVVRVAHHVRHAAQGEQSASHLVFALSTTHRHHQVHSGELHAPAHRLSPIVSQVRRLPLTVEQLLH